MIDDDRLQRQITFYTIDERLDVLNIIYPSSHNCIPDDTQYQRRRHEATAT